MRPDQELRMLNCRHITRLISQSMDARLPWPRRLAIRLHLLYCLGCRRYAAQLRFLRRAGRQLAAQALQAPPVALSSEARQQMVARLKTALKDPPAPRQ